MFIPLLLLDIMQTNMNSVMYKAVMISLVRKEKNHGYIRIVIFRIIEMWKNYEFTTICTLSFRLISVVKYFHHHYEDIFWDDPDQWCPSHVASLVHCNDVIMGTMASQITSLTSVYSTVYSGAYQRKHQSSASLVFVSGIHRGPVNSPHKWPVTRKVFPFDDVIMPQWVKSTRLSLHIGQHFNNTWNIW